MSQGHGIGATRHGARAAWMAAVLIAAFGAAETLQAQQRRGGEKRAPTRADVAYGDHPQQVLDFWRAEGEGPRPLALYIHGGGFRGGSKDTLNARALNGLLEAGVSVAAIEYRFIQHAPLPAAHRDVTRALQFLRSKAAGWGVDAERVGAFGGSAGAQLAMYLAFHDEMADPDAGDAIARQSTRLSCVATSGGQTTMDFRLWRKWVPGYDQPHRDITPIFGVETEEQYYEAAKKISAIDLLSPDDPPILMGYRMAPDDPVPQGRGARGWKVHHVAFGVKLKEKADRIGVEAHLRHPGHRPQPRSQIPFLVEKLTGSR